VSKGREIVSLSMSTKTEAGLEGDAAPVDPDDHIDSEVTRHESRILDAVGPEPIAVYRRLASEFAAGDIRANHVFQFLFRSYYRLDNAGLTREFKARYFELLEEHRGRAVIDLRRLAIELQPFRTLRNRESLQFSFITKLAATVNPSFPIYDNEVATIFGFRPPYGQGSFEERLGRCLEFYEWLRELYGRLLGSNRLLSTRNALETRYRYPVPLPPMKALDFIFWAAGKQRIRVVDRTIAYRGSSRPTARRRSQSR
jgi:hypothetical protein